MRPTTRLRELLKSNETLVVPGCYDAMSAKVMELVGFPAVYMTGYGTSLALLGMPDAGLATMTEMHLNARYMANAVKVPVIADADNGYGNAINVIRCVREYIQTGAAAIHIEDQAIPKRCGHVAGRRVIPMAEAVGKYRAADAAVAAISSPLLDFPIAEARPIVFNVVGGPDMGLREINSASEVIYENAHEDANIIFGAVVDDEMGDDVRVTVIAAGFDRWDGDRPPVAPGAPLTGDDAIVDVFADGDDLDVPSFLR